VRLVPQDPKASFNPRRTIGPAIERPLRLGGAGRASARREAAAALERVGLDADVAECLPGELSGGELQRASIARALVGGPRLLLGDEITSLLDSVVQATIVDLLHEIHVDLGLTMVLATHDLGLVRAVSDRTAVMSGGRVVEVGPTADVFGTPAHAVTAALLASRRRLPRTPTGVASHEPVRTPR
jgi:peptide/nickel transport system ATP-binding protein